MPKQCQDAYSVQFNLFPEMLSYHEDLRRRSCWVHTSVKSLEVAPLDKNAPLFSDHTGFDAKVAALLLGLQYPIHIGGMVAVDHRRQATVSDFTDSLNMLFAQFGDSIARLSGLLKVHLDHPVNAMTAVCKRLSLPKKAALDAIDMFEAAMGNDPATAHDVFMAMQEIPFNLKAGGKTAESKLLALQESMARALTLRWADYDYAKKVSW